MLQQNISCGTAVSSKIPSFAVDGDPHFIIELPEKNDALCFNINDKPGTIFTLIKDTKSGESWSASQLTEYNSFSPY